MSANIEGYAVAAGEGLLPTTMTIWLKTLHAFCASIYQTLVKGRIVAKYIYTLGTSTRSIEEFIRLLKSHGIEIVADVRRFPTSRFEHFHGEELSRFLEEAGIQYIHMGKELGGYRRGGYKSFMETGSFQFGLDRLEEIAKDKKAAIVCAERFPWRCHRRFIAAGLEARGWDVCHIIDGRRVTLAQAFSVPPGPL